MHVSTCRGLAVALLLLCALSSQLLAQLTAPLSFTSDPRDTLGHMRELEERRLMDPALGRVPYERLAEEREKLLNAQKSGTLSTQAAIPSLTWQERGPANVGGRTRALLFDPNDPAKKKVWAGSPGGGLWYTNDITDPNASWTSVGDDWESVIVTALAADPTNPQVMYAGTGDYYTVGWGGGIWKTTNGGQTWNRLTSTIPVMFQPWVISMALRSIQRIVVNPSGHVFVASSLGVVSSTDGGTTWQYALAPGQRIGTNDVTAYAGDDVVTDLEIGTDGILYTSFYFGGIYKSTTSAGTFWNKIGDFGPYNRVELALALSTDGATQVVYAMGAGGNDIVWMKKSVNAGTSWSDLAIPAYQSYVLWANGLMVHPGQPNTVYAGNHAWCRSTDGGQTWSAPVTEKPYYVHGLVFQPGSSSAAVQISDQGVHWISDVETMNDAPATVVDRNKGYRTAAAHSAAMNPAAGSAEFVATTGLTGSYLMSATGVSAATLLASQMRQLPGLVHVDQYEGFYLFGDVLGTRIYRADSTRVSVALSGPTSAAAQLFEYDSRSKTIYYADENYGRGYGVGKYICVGGNPSSTSLALTGNAQPTALKLGRSQNTVFVGTFGRQLIRVSNTDKPVPTVTYLNTGNMNANSSISCIDIGATDNELLVTLSNYGIASVWYTNDGGNTWVNKDEATHGLPDVPVWSVLFNPRNRQQVLLGTSLGVWSTTAIQANNPVWELTNTGMPLIGVRDLRLRPSDGMVSVAAGRPLLSAQSAAGRGVFTTNAFAYTPISVSLTGVSTKTICVGSPFSVSFVANAPALLSYAVWISAADGSWCSPRLVGSGSGSPIQITLPTGDQALPYGTGYRLRVATSGDEAISRESGPLHIGYLADVSIVDRNSSMKNFTSGDATICVGDELRLAARATDGAGRPMTVDSYQWFKDGTALTGATSATLLVTERGIYSVEARWHNRVKQSQVYYVNESFRVSAQALSTAGIRPRCNGQPIQLYSDYLGERAALQWSLNAATLAGATSYSLLATQSGHYKVDLSFNGCSLYASDVPAQVVLGALIVHARLDQPGDSVLCSTGTTGNFVRLTVDDTTRTRASLYTFRWYRDGVLLQNQAMYYLNADQPGNYVVELQEGSCTTRSNALVVTRGTAIMPPFVEYDGGASVCTLAAQTIYARSLYDPPYTSANWQKDGIDLPDPLGYFFTVYSTGTYTLRVTRGTCIAISRPVSITFSDAFKPIIKTPGDEYTCGSRWLDAYGNVANLLNRTVYQWFKDGQPIAGATNSRYYATQPGLYSVSVTNGFCSGQSNEFWNKPGTPTKPIVVGLGNRNLCAGNGITLKIFFYNAVWDSQWKRNGVDIMGAVSNNYVAMEPGVYSVRTTSECGTAESAPVDIRIGEPTAATITGNALVSAGQTTVLLVQLSGPAPWSFTLSTGQVVQNTYLNPHPLSVTATATTAYSVAAVQNACGAGTSAGSATVTVGSGNADLALASVVSSRVPRVGDVVGYTLVLTNESGQDANGVVVTNRLPAGVEFVEAESAGVTADNGLVTANVGTVAGSSQAIVSYRLRATLPGTFFNAAQVAQTNTPDPDSQPNSGTGDGEDDQTVVDLRTVDAAGTLIASANPNQTPLPAVQSNQPTPQAGKVELSLDLRTSALVPKAGQPFNLSVILGNRGAATATNVAVEVLLPTGWSLTNTTGFVVNGQTVRGYVNNLPAGTLQGMVLPVQANIGGLVQAQLLDVSEPVANATPGNGYTNGERDEASLSVRVR